ncbi:hypothetical protein Ciccas_004674 [Cichlidogyrus casuarinus]|uniref:Uncharacterized protein n=1 Tax=Cichlidogyrus casuarinus TaxID=1844966 RepID=A0ABD2QAU8_9PLAT
MSMESPVQYNYEVLPTKKPSESNTLTRMISSKIFRNRDAIESWRQPSCNPLRVTVPFDVDNSEEATLVRNNQVSTGTTLSEELQENEFYTKEASHYLEPSLREEVQKALQTGTNKQEESEMVYGMTDYSCEQQEIYLSKKRSSVNPRPRSLDMQSNHYYTYAPEKCRESVYETCTPVA